MSQHISPRTAMFYIWHHITPQSVPPTTVSHHRPHLEAQHIPYHAATVHISHHSTPTASTPHPHSTSQHISHHTDVPHHITPLAHLDFTSHHHITYDIATHCIFFRIWLHTTVTRQHIAYATFFTTISHHILQSNFLHLHYAFHTTPLIFHTTLILRHFNRQFHITPCLTEMATFHISRTTFHIHHNSHQITPSRHTIPHRADLPPRTTSCTSHSNINCTSHSTHSKPHHTSHSAFQPSFRITPPCLIWRQTIPHHSVFHNHISFTSCITAHHHIPRVPHHHSTSHHYISQHLTLHNTTFSNTPHSTSHLIKPH